MSSTHKKKESCPFQIRLYYAVGRKSEWSRCEVTVSLKNNNDREVWSLIWSLVVLSLSSACHQLSNIGSAAVLEFACNSFLADSRVGCLWRQEECYRKAVRLMIREVADKRYAGHYCGRDLLRSTVLNVCCYWYHTDTQRVCFTTMLSFTRRQISSQAVPGGETAGMSEAGNDMDGKLINMLRILLRIMATDVLSGQGFPRKRIHDCKHICRSMP